MFIFRNIAVRFNLDTETGRAAFLDYAMCSIQKGIDRSVETQNRVCTKVREKDLREVFKRLADGIHGDDAQ